MNTTASSPSTPPDQPDWSALAALLCLQEWQACQRLLATADALLQLVRLDPGASTAGLERRAASLIQVAFRLGRQATGLDQKKKDTGPTGPPPLTPEEQAEIDRVYGPSAPPTPNPAPAPSTAPAPSSNAAPSAAPAPPQPEAAPKPGEAPSQPAPAPESQIETQNSKIPAPEPPPTPAPAEAAPTPTPQPPPQPAPAPESQIETQNSKIPSSPSEPKQNETPPVAPQPGEAGTTLNAQPTSQPTPAPEFKIEPQNSTIPPNLPSPFSYERSPINTHPNSQPVPSLEEVLKTIRAQTPSPPRSQPTNPPASQFIIEPENPEIQPVLPEAMGAFRVARQPVPVVLQLYQQLSGLQLEIDPSVPKGALVTAGSGPSVTRTQALRILESALRYQAGVLLTPLGAGRVRVACDPARRQSSPRDRPA